MKRNKGITLIALIITIIILVILAAVTINNLIGTDLIGSALNGAISYQIASEREYLEQNVLLVQAGKYIENVSSEKLGDALNEKRLDNSSNWHIIKVNDKTYDTGWNYIGKGTELKDFGQTKNAWLVNYETGEIIQLEEDKYMSLSAGDMVAIKDSLIVNIDSSIIDKEVENEQEALEKQLGENVKLINFDYDENSGLTNTSFNFDGKDDYITVQYDKQEQKDVLANNGFTFEFYGIWNGGTTDSRLPNETYKGLFVYWDGNENSHGALRFGIVENELNLLWTAAPDEIRDNEYVSDYSADPNYNYPMNILYNVSDQWEKGQVIYITVTLDTSKKQDIYDEKFIGINERWKDLKKNGEFYKQAIYINGELLYEGDYNAKAWEYFCEKKLSKLDRFCIGRCSFRHPGYWNYSKMNAYALRLYSRGLSKEEVMQNYKKSVEYHSLSTN